MRDAFVFHRAVYEAVKDLPPEMFKEWALAVMEYGLDRKEPATPLGAACVGAIRARMDADYTAWLNRCERNRENGAHGGRPKKPTETHENPMGYFGPPMGGERNPQKPDSESDKDIKEKTIPKGIVEKKSEKRFSAPTVEDVKGYCNEKGLSVDADRFVDFYASKGWRVGNAPMKDWRAACRNWARQDRTPAKPKTNAFKNFEERGNDLDAEMFARIRAKREAVG